MLKITPKKMAAYRLTAQKRQEQEAQRLLQRKKEAWRIAVQAARVLKDEFGCTRVILHGSLTGNAPFHHRSDVDLAAEGLDEKAYYRAIVRLMDLSSTVSIDLARLEDLPDSFQRAVEEKGIALDENRVHGFSRTN